jgi:hypothetical protein
LLLPLLLLLLPLLLLPLLLLPLLLLLLPQGRHAAPQPPSTDRISLHPATTNP